MKKIYMIMTLFAIMMATMFSACSKDDVVFSPEVPYNIELSNSEYCNGDSLYGKIVIKTTEMVSGTQIKKIDCRLGNIVIGTTTNKTENDNKVVENKKDKPLGYHIFSVIIKCESPDCDETYWRHDYKNLVKIVSSKDTNKEN